MEMTMTTDNNETRNALREAAILNNVRVLTECPFPPDVTNLVDVREVLERFDRGEPIQ